MKHGDIFLLVVIGLLSMLFAKEMPSSLEVHGRQYLTADRSERMQWTAIHGSTDWRVNAGESGAAYRSGYRNRGYRRTYNIKYRTRYRSNNRSPR